MQLSYSQNMTKAVAGARYGIGPVVIDSLNAEGAVGIGFGVIAGTDPENQAKVPAATFSAGFKGIALLDAAKDAQTYERELVASEETELLQQLRNKGLEINEVEKQEEFFTKARPLRDLYVRRYGQQAKDLLQQIDALRQ